MADPLYLTAGLAGGVAIVFSLAAYQVLRGRFLGGGRVRADSTAFLSLAAALRGVYPSMPAGFTWREAMARLEAGGVKADWGKFTEELERYEARKYGREAAEGSYPEVAKVARALWSMA